MEPRILVLLAFASLASAGPISSQQSETQCATQCSSSSKWNYESGTTYLYDYRVDTVTSMSGASEDSAKLTLTATAQLKVLGDCEMALSLRGSRLYHSDSTGQMRPAEGMEEFHRAVEGSPLRFSFQEGRIEHVCPVEGEQTWALNLKKGVLSAFQHQLAGDIKEQNFTETDVAGTCQTEYKVTSDGYYSTSVRKVKDIMSCTDRVNYYRTVMQMVPYHEPSAIQSLPVMKSNHRCDQVIEKGGLLQSSTCQESHVYRPFSNGQSGGATSVEQTLTYKTYQHGVSSAQDSFASRESLVFVHHGSHLSPEQAAQHTEQKLKEICESTEYDVRPESPRLFSELVSAIKGLERQQMEEILSKLKIKSLCPNNNKARTIFLDALPMASTTASVDMMSSLIINKKIPGLQVNAYLTSLALIPSPSADMLRAVKPLLDTLQRQDALLPISSMVNNFCLKNKKCTWFVDDIMAAFEKDINYYCDASSDYKFTKTLLALRAIGNAGHSSRAVPVVNKCLTSVSNPLEIRVAAAEAFRRMPCDADATELWNTYENVELDSELRIAAYLALMRCPSDVTLAKMAISLNTELGEQVGSFVYSHLTNLRETSDPHKQDVARAIDNIEIPSKFASSPLKASTNLEASALINKINTGFVGESNLVWSSDAQLPRSASANLTVELFGQSVNLLDFGGRIEGLDRILKNYFGNYFGIEKTTSEQISGSVYARVFGNEVLFLHSGKSFGVVPADSFTTKLFDMLVNPNVDGTKFSHSSQFLDIGLCIPTIAGLPIHIDVNGSAVVDLLVNGKMQLPSILGNKDKLIEVEGEIRPSAALEITGTMSVDAFVTKTGLRMRNVMHSSTALKGHLKVKDSELVSVELDTPEDQMDVFQASSKFFILHNNEEQEQKMITENRKEFEICSSDKLVDITGVVLCGQVSFPNGSHQTEGPYFPLTGPSSVSLTLRKVDSHSGYKLLAKNVENKRSKLVQISFNTPGSRVNRLILIDINLDKSDNQLDAEVNTPWKTATFKGSFANNKELKSISGKLLLDERDEFAVNSEVKVTGSSKKVHVSPVFEIRKPGMKPILLTGYMLLEARKAFEVDVSLSGLQDLPYKLKTSLINKWAERSVVLSFSRDGGKSQYHFEVANKFQMNRKMSSISSLNSMDVRMPKWNLISALTKADYKQGKSLKLVGKLDMYRVMRKTAFMNVDIIKTDKRRGASYDIDAQVKSTLVNGRLDSNIFLKDSGLMSMKTSLDYSIVKVAKNKIVVSGKFNDRSTNAYTKYTTKGSIRMQKSPEYNMDVFFELDHKKKHSEADVEIKYGPNFKDKSKRITLSTVLNRKITNYKNAALNYKIKAQAPEHNINVFLTGEHEHSPAKLDSNLQLNYGKNQDLKASVFLKDNSDKTTKVNGRASVSWPGNDYKLISKVDQKNSKVYTHTLSLMKNNAVKHSAETNLKLYPENKMLKSVLNLDGWDKVIVLGSVDASGKAPQAKAEIQVGKDTYGLSTKAKRANDNSGIVIVEMFHPERRVLMKIDGEKTRVKSDGSVELFWDADNDKSKKITLGGSVFNKKYKKISSFGGDLTFTSPFDQYENLAGTFKYTGDEAQHATTGKLNWGGKHKQVVTSLNLKKPFSLSYFEGSVELKTPFNKMRTISADVSHNWQNALRTILKGSLNKENAKLLVKGQGSLNSLKANVDFTSSIKNAEDISASLSHNHGQGNVESTAKINHNGKNINVDFVGSHKLSNTRDINGELSIRTPWELMRNMRISFDHKHGNGFLNNKASVLQGQKTKALSDINVSMKNNKVDLDFNIVSPFHEDFSGKFNSQHGSYPILSNLELQWHPRKKITAETSVDAKSWDDAAFNVQLTLPVRGFRKVSLDATNKKLGDEVVSNVNFDYGVRNSINFEARNMLTNKSKKTRVTLFTPFDSIKSLDAGLTFDGKPTNFVSRADFEMIPAVGKYEGSAKWKYDDNMSGTLRLDTPHPDYPYLELSTSSKHRENTRQSHVEVKMHPRKMYGLDAVYSLTLPISVEVNTISSDPDYDNLGMMIQHNHTPYSIVSRAELRYQPDNKVEADLNGEWNSEIDGSLVVKTPFSGYENSKLSIRHKGDMDDFTSHGEIHAAEKSVVADASFKSGYTTTGMLSLITPISGMENVKLNIKKKGRAQNLKGDLTLSVNDEKIDIDYNHKVTKEGLKSGFKLFTPRTEPLKLSFDHSGDVEKFTNEISASYGRKYLVDSMISFDYSKPDINAHSTLKYKLGGRRNTARASFNKYGPSNDMSFRGTTGLNEDEINVAGSLKIVESVNGDIQISTPFAGFKNIGMNIAHSGPIHNFKSSADLTYMDNKNINGEISLTADGLELVRFNSKIATPFIVLPSATLDFNNNYDVYRNEMSGDASLTTPIADFGTGSLTYTKSGDLKNLNVVADAKRNGRNIASLNMKNTQRRQDIHSNLNAYVSDYPTLSLKFDHAYQPENNNVIDTKVSADLGEDNMNAEISMRKLEGVKDGVAFTGSVSYNNEAVEAAWTVMGDKKDFDSKVEIKTPFDNFNDVGMSISHSVNDDIHSFVSVEYMDEKTITLKTKLFSKKEVLSAAVELTTPFKDFESTKADIKFILEKELKIEMSAQTTINDFGSGKLAFIFRGDPWDLVIDGSIVHNTKEIGKITLTNLVFDHNVKIHFNVKGASISEIDFTVDHSCDKLNSVTYVGGEINDRTNKPKTVNGKISFMETRSRKNFQAAVELNVDIDSVVSKQNIAVNLDSGDGLEDIVYQLAYYHNEEEYKINGKLDVKKTIEGSVTINTPVEKYTNVGVSFKITPSEERKDFKINFEGKINIVDDEQFSGVVDFYKSPSQLVEITVEINTPIKNAEHLKLFYTHENLRKAMKGSGSLEYGQEKMSYDFSVSTKPKPEFSVIIKTPYENYEDLMASGTLDASWSKYEMNTKVSAGLNREVTLDALFDFTKDITGSIELKTPVKGIKNVGINIQHSGDAQRFDTEGKITYMDGKDIHGRVNFYRYKWSRIEATAELKTPFKSAKMTKAEIMYEENSNGLSTTAALEFGEEKKIDGNLKLTFSPSYDALLTINTPFDEFNKAHIQGSLDLTAPSYSAGYSVNLGDDYVYSANGKLNLFSAKKVDSSLEVVLPIKNLEFTKVEYQHDIDTDKVDGSVSLIFGDGKIISSNLKLSSSPNFDVSVILKTPFRGYKRIQGSASYNNNYNKYDASTSLSFGRRHKFSLNSGLDLSAEPYRASVQVATPYNDYRNMELVLTHEGVLNNFHSTGFLTSPLTDTMNADVNLKFNSHFDMEASASLKSNIQGLDDLTAEIKNSDAYGEKKTRAVVGWTSGQQIVFDGTFHHKKGYYKDMVSGEMSLSTPFIAVRNLAVSIEHSGKQDESSQTVGLELNGHKLIDADTTFSMKDKHLASITTRKPMPMKYTVSGSSKDGLTEVDVLANWNMDKIDSNAQLVAALNDQSDSYKTDCSLDIGLEHASRKMGVFHKLTSSNTDTASSGKIYWDSDDASKLSYDMEVKDSNRRGKVVKDGHVIVSLPTRSLKLAGSSSDNQVTKSGDFVFSWDADHQDKQVGVKGTLTRGDRIKGDITLSMPAIDKEIRVDGQLMTNNGRILLDTKTDISYSHDSRKTLTLTSKLEDISDYYSHYNYSLAVGVSHPYTNVDIQMNSHLGSSDEKMTVGLNTDYLTSRRQTKTLGLLAEINSLKRQLSLQVIVPEKKVEIIGEVPSLSPYKLSLLNKVNDVEGFRSDITVDQDKDFIELSFLDGSDGVTVWAGYPNSTAFQGEVKRISYGNELTESLLAVRLNTSRLMHTRLHWNPNMVEELRLAVKQQAVSGIFTTGYILAEINAAVEEEITQKYVDISGAIVEELKVLVDELEAESKQISRMMAEWSRKMEVAFQNDNFYIRDLGPITKVYLEAKEVLDSFRKSYKKRSDQVIETLRELLSKMSTYPIRERYTQIVTDGAVWAEKEVQKMLLSLESMLVDIEEGLKAYKKELVDINVNRADAMMNNSNKNYVARNLAKIPTIDLIQWVPSVEIPKEYAHNIRKYVHDLHSGVHDGLNSLGLQSVSNPINEVYQQGVWAHNYWQVEKNIERHTNTILELLVDIIEDELKHYLDEVYDKYYPITVWDPEHGEVQADIVLPFEVERLDQAPEMKPAVDHIVSYLPDSTTAGKVSKFVGDNFWWSNQEPDVNNRLRM